MRVVINVVLVAVVLFLLYVLYQSIKEPIAFKEIRDTRQKAVVDKLMRIREAQKAYAGVTGGSFANDFDSLKYVLMNDSFEVEQIFEQTDPDSDEEFIRVTTMVPARDSIARAGIVLDSIEYVPYTRGEKFTISADTLTYQKTLVDVVEVGVPIKNFMGKYADVSYKKYDNNYDPNKVLKFGDMNRPTLSGNWE